MIMSMRPHATPSAVPHWTVVKARDFPYVVSVVIPVFNERATIEAVVARVRAVFPRLELIVVDDGSTDGTRDLLTALAARGDVSRLIFQPTNRGKGAAVRTGIQAATGDLVTIQDADFEYDPMDVLPLLDPILDGRADAVLGSRFRGPLQRVMYFWHYVVNRGLTCLSNMCTNLNLSDMETAVKVFRTDLIQQLPLTSDRFGFEPEVVARLAQSGARVYEGVVTYSGRTYAEGKKITWRDGLAALGHILRSSWGRTRAPRVSLLPFGDVVAARYRTPDVEVA
jgi:glycosyltransferase involved in cell wall biosynthesis